MNKAQKFQRVAGRYAEALLALAVQQNAVDGVESDFRQLDGMIKDSADFRALLSDQTEQRDTHARAVEAMAVRAGFSDLTKKFLGVVAMKRRLRGLDDIIRAFFALNAKRLGILDAEIYTAKPLPAALKDKLAAALKDKMGREVRISEYVKPSVLGGLQVRIGSLMIDDTVEGKIQRLEHVLTQQSTAKAA